MEKRATQIAAMAAPVRVTIVDRPGVFPASSAGLIRERRPAGLITRVGFARLMELGLMAANAAIWVGALPISLG
jgi:hypothetical protein